MCQQTFKCGWSPNWREVIRLQTPGAAYNEFDYHQHPVITSSHYRPQRSCGKVMFYTCLWFCSLGGSRVSVRGVLCPSGLCPGGSLSGRPPIRLRAGCTHPGGMHSCFSQKRTLLIGINDGLLTQGGHGTGKTGNLVLTFSRQGKHREFVSNTGKNLPAQGKYLDCDY